jgi:peptide deformylase
MVLPIVKFGNPVLRARGRKVTAIDPDIEQFAADLLETMRAAHGVGLAAQQVGRALQMAVVDVRGVKDRPSLLWLDGHEADVDAYMPVVLINPVLEFSGELVRGTEGCLSFPEVYGDVERRSEVIVNALNLRGEPFKFKAAGLLSRAVQHETDHLNGILFIDRMSTATRKEVQADIDSISAETKRQASGK